MYFGLKEIPALGYRDASPEYQEGVMMWMLESELTVSIHYDCVNTYGNTPYNSYADNIYTANIQPETNFGTRFYNGRPFGHTLFYR
jgi:hypothetical protein